MPYTEAQQWALVLAPKFSGLLSMVFSSFVIWTVAICANKRSKTYHRLVLGISCVDVLSSVWLGLSTWPIPRETGILWAVGNTQSCTAQGFFTQFGITSSFYNVSLSLFYLLVIRYGWRERRLLKLEPWLHAIPLTWGLGTATAGLPLNLYNSADLWCWIAPHDSRGSNMDLYRWIFFYVPLWINILFVTFSVLLIFQHVRRLERASDRHKFESFMHTEVLQPGDYETKCSVKNPTPLKESNGNLEQQLEAENCTKEPQIQLATLEENDEPATEPTTEIAVQADCKKGTFAYLRSLCSCTPEETKPKRRRTREVANQSLRYAGSMYVAWTAVSLSRLLQATNGRTYFPLLFIAAATTPMQGLPNLLVYLYPRFQKTKKENPGRGFWFWLKGCMAPEPA